MEMWALLGLTPPHLERHPPSRSKLAVIIQEADQAQDSKQSTCECISNVNVTQP